MKKISVPVKSGFVSHDKFLKIYDNKERLFYFHTLKPGQRTVHFNLPPGNYFSNNKIGGAPVRKYKLPNLPKRERKFTIPKKITVTYRENPNKASIFIDKNLVILDPSIKGLSRPQIVYILNHERGHYLYSTESYCDLYAMRRMLISGYNPSQIAMSLHGALSNAPGALERKEFIVEHCEKIFL